MGPLPCRWLVVFLLWVFAFFAFVRPAQGSQISGSISSTLIITDDSELVGDVTYTVENRPCIVIGASHVKLRLNGFSIAGTVPGCTPSTSFDGWH